MCLFHVRLSTYRICNGHQTTIVTTTSHRSCEMVVCLSPQRTLVTGMKQSSYCEINIRDAFLEPASPLSRRNETHLFLRAFAFSLLKETLAFNLRLLYLNERDRSWGPPVRTDDGLLHCPLHCGHVCNGLSE
jgi:hypothetical protein